MHSSWLGRWAVIAVAVALVGSSATAVSAAAGDEVTRSVWVQDQPGSMATVVDLTAPGSAISGGTRVFDTWSQLSVRLQKRPGVFTDLLLQVSGATAPTPGTYTVTSNVFAADLAPGQALFNAGFSCPEQTGSVTVHEMETVPGESGTATAVRLALSYEIDCVSYPWKSTDGEVRFASAHPVAAAVVESTTASPPTVVLDQAATSTLTYRNVGSVPAHLGSVSIVPGLRSEDWTITSDDCSETTVAAGASCSVGLRVVPSELTGNSTPAPPEVWRLGMSIPHDLDDAPVTAESVVSVLSVWRPAPLSVVGLVDRTVLEWPHSLNALGYRVESSDDGGPWQPVTTVAKGVLRAVDPRHAPAASARRYRLVSITPTGYPGVVGEPVTAAESAPELVVTERDSTGGSYLVSVSATTGQSVRSRMTSDLQSPPSLSLLNQTIAWGGTKSSGARLIITRGFSEDSSFGCGSMMCSSDPVFDPVSGPGGRYAWSTTGGAALRVSGFGGTAAQDVGLLTEVQHPTWARDGRTLLAASTTGGELRSVQLDATGATIAGSLATIPGTAGALRPSASPQADEVAFLTGTGDGAQVRVTSLTGGDVLAVATVPGARHISWTPDGSDLVVTSQGTEGSTIERVDVPSGTRTALYSTTGAATGAVMRVLDREGPSLTLSAPSHLLGTSTVGFQLSDDTRPVGDLTLSCVLDNSSVPCTPSGWSGRVGRGQHQLTVAASHAGFPATTASAQWETRTPQRKTDLDSDGNADLLARDSTGRLYLYPGDGHGSFKTRRAYGTGWNAMTSIAASPDFDLTGTVDLLASDSTGQVFLYPGNGQGGLGARTLVATKMTGRVVAVGDLNGDGNDDLLWVTTAGEAHVMLGDGHGKLAGSYSLGRGWSNYTAIVAVGDLTGDSRPDVLTRDGNGRLYRYSFNEAGFPLPVVAYGTGWNAMTALLGPGDFNGDGRADLLARDTNGRLHMYPGNGQGGFGTRVSYGTGWNAMTAIVG